MMLAGRGFGKTRSLVEWVRHLVETGQAKRIAIVSPTAADARDVIVEGESGIIAQARPDFSPKYESSKRRITWPNGAIATLYSAEEGARLRGPQHDAAVCDELAVWSDPETWDNLRFGLRLGSHPKIAIATTPKRVPLLRRVLGLNGLVVTTGSTHENMANLAPAFRAQIAEYEGTTLGRQELYAELLTDVEGALFTTQIIRVLPLDDQPREYRRTIVAVDPALSYKTTSAETGIVVASECMDGTILVRADLSGRLTSEQWGQRVVDAYVLYGAERVLIEKNAGVDLLPGVIHRIDATIPVELSWSSDDKATRAEPVVQRYERGEVAHARPFPALEDQMTGWIPGTKPSPDRLDALTLAVTALAARELSLSDIYRAY